MTEHRFQIPEIDWEVQGLIAVVLRDGLVHAAAMIHMRCQKRLDFRFAERDAVAFAGVHDGMIDVSLAVDKERQRVSGQA
jgi:hypothetical protein